MSRKTKRETRQVFAVQAQLDKLKEEEWNITVRERPWLDDNYHLNPENENKEMVIVELPEERRAIEIKIAEVQNELMKLMEDYGWSN